MKVHDVIQGSEEWLRLRAGVVTASEIDGVLTPKTLKPSDSRSYFNRLVAERVLGKPVMSEAESAAMGRGRELEYEAREWYEAEHGFVNGGVELCGFVTDDAERIGASPDALVGTAGGLEIKTPLLDTHVGYLLDRATLRAKYRGQVQVALYVTGRAWWDLMSWNPAPEFPPVVVRCEPEPAYQAALASELPKFLARLDEAVARLGGDLAVRRLSNPFL